MRMVGRGVVAPPPTPNQDLPYGSRWSFARRTRTHTGSGIGFYRDQLDLLRADQFRWDPYPAEAYTALPQHSGIQTGVWRACVPLICFDIVEVHLPERVMCQFGMVQVIPPPCNTEVELHHSSRKGTAPKDWSEINGRHIARWSRRLELLAQGASIDAAGASTSVDYMPWYLSITRRWMTPRGFVAASQYASAAPVMTQFAQGAAAVIQSSHEQPVREIANNILHGTQFQHFIPVVAEETSPTTLEVQPSSPAKDIHLQEVDLSYPLHGSGSSQAGSSQYQSPLLPERHTNVSYYRRRRKRPSQSERVQEEDDN
ncbi:unnamed protein product [Amaranthus hypochondriacus]